MRLLHTTPAGDLREDLIAEMEAFQAALTTSGLGRMMIAIGQQARDDAELADLSSSVRADGSKVLRDIIAAGVERRELPSDLEPDVAVAQLVGPVLFRFLFESEDDFSLASVTSVVIDAVERAQLLRISGRTTGSARSPLSTNVVHARMAADQKRREAAGPGGHSGTTTQSSVTDLTPDIGSSDKPLPRPASPQPRTPRTLTPATS